MCYVDLMKNCSEGPRPTAIHIMCVKFFDFVCVCTRRRRAYELKSAQAFVKGRTWLRDPVLRLGGVRCVSTSIRMPWRIRTSLGQGEVRRAPEPVVILRVDVRAGSNVWIVVKYLGRDQMFGPWRNSFDQGQMFGPRSNVWTLVKCLDPGEKVSTRVKCLDPGQMFGPWSNVWTRYLDILPSMAVAHGLAPAGSP